MSRVHATRLQARRCLAAAMMVFFALPPTGAVSPADQPPTPTGLTEKVEKRLVQVDVAVEGDRDAILAITAKDVTLYAGEHEV